MRLSYRIVVMLNRQIAGMRCFLEHFAAFCDTHRSYFKGIERGQLPNHLPRPLRLLPKTSATGSPFNSIFVPPTRYDIVTVLANS